MPELPSLDDLFATYNRLEVIEAYRRQMPELDSLILLCDYLWRRLEIAERKIVDMEETMNYLAPPD